MEKTQNPDVIVQISQQDRKFQDKSNIIKLENSVMPLQPILTKPKFFSLFENSGIMFENQIQSSFIQQLKQAESVNDRIANVNALLKTSVKILQFFAKSHGMHFLTLYLKQCRQQPMSQKHFELIDKIAMICDKMDITKEILFTSIIHVEFEELKNLDLIYEKKDLHKRLFMLLQKWKNVIDELEISKQDMLLEKRRQNIQKQLNQQKFIAKQVALNQIQKKPIDAIQILFKAIKKQVKWSEGDKIQTIKFFKLFDTPESEGTTEEEAKRIKVEFLKTYKNNIQAPQAQTNDWKHIESQFEGIKRKEIKEALLKMEPQIAFTHLQKLKCNRNQLLGSLSEEKDQHMERIKSKLSCFYSNENMIPNEPSYDNIENCAALTRTIPNYELSKFQNVNNKVITDCTLPANDPALMNLIDKTTPQQQSDLNDKESEQSNSNNKQKNDTNKNGLKPVLAKLKGILKHRKPLASLMTPGTGFLLPSNDESIVKCKTEDPLQFLLNPGNLKLEQQSKMNDDLKTDIVQQLKQKFKKGEKISKDEILQMVNYMKETGFNNDQIKAQVQQLMETFNQQNEIKADESKICNSLSSSIQSDANMLTQKISQPNESIKVQSEELQNDQTICGDIDSTKISQDDIYKNTKINTTRLVPNPLQALFGQQQPVNNVNNSQSQNVKQQFPQVKPQNYKSIPCKNFHSLKGCQRSEDQCNFIHDKAFPGIWPPMKNVQQNFQKNGVLNQQNGQHTISNQNQTVQLANQHGRQQIQFQYTRPQNNFRFREDILMSKCENENENTYNNNNNVQSTQQSSNDQQQFNIDINENNQNTTVLSENNLFENSADKFFTCDEFTVSGSDQKTHPSQQFQPNQMINEEMTTPLHNNLNLKPSPTAVMNLPLKPLLQRKQFTKSNNPAAHFFFNNSNLKRGERDSEVDELNKCIMLNVKRNNPFFKAGSVIGDTNNCINTNTSTSTNIVMANVEESLAANVTPSMADEDQENQIHFATPLQKKFKFNVEL